MVNLGGLSFPLKSFQKKRGKPRHRYVPPWEVSKIDLKGWLQVKEDIAFYPSFNFRFSFL